MYILLTPDVYNVHTFIRLLSPVIFIALVNLHSVYDSSTVPVYVCWGISGREIRRWIIPRAGMTWHRARDLLALARRFHDFIQSTCHPSSWSHADAARNNVQISPPLQIRFTGATAEGAELRRCLRRFCQEDGLVFRQADDRRRREAEIVRPNESTRWWSVPMALDWIARLIEMSQLYIITGFDEGELYVLSSRL